jgi:hypothetical protein
LFIVTSFLDELALYRQTKLTSNTQKDPQNNTSEQAMNKHQKTIQESKAESHTTRTGTN